MRTWIKAVLAGALALGPAAAFAAIDNTRHDMIYVMGYTERCAFCHSKVGLTTALIPVGKVGNFCVQVCHVINSGLDTAGRDNVVPTAPGSYSYAAGAFTMANAGSTDTGMLTAHGFDATLLPNLNTGATTEEELSVAGTGWPYTQAGILMQCTSCHAVHDASNPPFLNAKLAASGAAAQTDNFCARCHSNPGRVQDFTAVGNHPTEFEWDPAAAAIRSATKAGTVQNGRAIVRGTGITNLNVKNASLADDAPAGALNASTAVWDLGGHLIAPATGLPQSGRDGANNENVGCYSCHQVHQVGNTVASELGSALLVGNDITDVCYGCHTMEPGAGVYGHPIDEDEPLNHATGWPAIVLSPEFNDMSAFYKPAADNKAPVKAGALNAPFCVTCHDVHQAATGPVGGGRMAIRVIGGATIQKASYAATDAVCETCHTTNGASSWGNPTAANAHHPGSTTTNYVLADAFPASIVWTTADNLGDLNDGLTCGDCHIGDGRNGKRATAHNWN